MALGKIKADQLEHSTAGSVDTQYVVDGSAKYWIQHSGDSPTVDASLNHSSLTDNGTGDITYTFTNAFSNGFYPLTATSTEDASIGYVTIYYHRNYSTRISTSVNLVGIDHNNSYDDGRWTNVVAMGDLA